MTDKQFLSGKEKEVREQADLLMDALDHNSSIYIDADVVADIADYYAMNGQPQLMQRTVDYGLSIHPDNTDILIQKAYMYLDANQMDKAQQIVWNLGETTVDVKLLQAYTLFKQGNQEEARALLEELIEENDPEIAYQLANILLDFGEPERAYETLTRLIPDSKEPDYLEILAACDKDMGRIHEAIEGYNLVLNIQPYNTRVWRELAECYYETAAYSQCINACEFGLVADPYNVEITLIEGYCFIQLKNFKKAYELLSGVKAIFEKHPYLDYYMQALLAMDGEEYTEAYHLLRKAISYNEMEPEFYINSLAIIGIYLLYNDQVEEAEVYIDRAMSIDPNDAEVMRLKAEIFSRKGNRMEAEPLWNHCIEQTERATDLVNLGFYFISLKEMELAYLSMKKAWDINPHCFSELYSALYILSIYTNRPTEAKYYKKFMPEGAMNYTLDEEMPTDLFVQSMGMCLNLMLDALLEKFQKEMRGEE